ncbi:MAG: putative ABC transporter permease [Bacteroidales bacterium]|nr:putative ABC transporter permease [Lachnoclostridium sp.]MCM1383361.1 putative ABC transporter permease [Lachnoclostridium sp.]MCM1465026.1 putative ABC transporter permease [Bacteroidales bacterium]
MKYNVFALGIMAAIVSFLGFVVENLWLAVTKGYMNNRNMNAPFLLGYGLFILILFIVLGTPEGLVERRIFKKIQSKEMRYAVYFVCSFVAVSVGEILLGTTVERLCHIEYWNYSNLPMHITKYTSVPTSLGFATGITIFMGKFFSPLMEWINRFDVSQIKTVSITVTLIMVLDFFYSFYHIMVHQDFYLKWRIEITDLRVCLCVAMIAGFLLLQGRRNPKILMGEHREQIV